MDPHKRMESPRAAAMTTTQFMNSCRKVLRAAYEYAGYDVDTHISTADCPAKSSPQGPNLGLTLRIPLSARRQFGHAPDFPSIPSSPADFSIAAIADSTAIPDINIPDYDHNVVEQLRKPPVVRLKNIGIVELVPQQRQNYEIGAESIDVDDDDDDGDVDNNSDVINDDDFDNDHVNTPAIEYLIDDVSGEKEGGCNTSMTIKIEKPTKTAKKLVPPSSSISPEEGQETGEEQQNDVFLNQLQFFKETEQVIENGLHRREQFERDENELAESRKIYQQNLEMLEAKIEGWMKIGEEVVYNIEEMMSDSKIDDAYRKMAKEWIDLISKALKMATEAVETVQRQAEEMEEEERIWKETESRLALSLKEATAERRRVEMYLKQIVEKEQQLRASTGAKSIKKSNGKRKRSEIDDG